MAASMLRNPFLMIITLLALLSTTATCTRVLLDELPADSTIIPPPDTSLPDPNPVVAAASPAVADNPAGDTATGVGGVPDTTTPDATTTPQGPVTAAPGLPATTGPTTTGPAAAAGATGPAGPTTTGHTPSSATNTLGHPTMIFYMHDILGGSNPSAKAVTGIVSNPAISGGQIPFAKPNGAVLSTNNGVPQNNDNSGLINNNNLPLLVGLGGTTQNIAQNFNNNNNGGIMGGGGFPVVNGAQLSAGTTLQKLTFGTLTVIDDELTEGLERGSGMIGKAQGFYVASSIEGTSQTLAFTTMFQEGGFEDSIVFFGIHRTAVSESYLGIMGGTGKYMSAKGFAKIKILPSPGAQHETDGFHTLVEVAVFLTHE